MIVIICAKYKKNPTRTVVATERTRFSKSRLNDLEDIGQGQRSSQATHPPMLLIICTKYGKNPSWTVDATGRTRKVNVQTARQTARQPARQPARQTRQTDRQTDGQTDGQTDRQTDRQGESNIAPLTLLRGYNKAKRIWYIMVPTVSQCYIDSWENPCMTFAGQSSMLSWQAMEMEPVMQTLEETWCQCFHVMQIKSMSCISLKLFLCICHFLARHKYRQHEHLTRLRHNMVYPASDESKCVEGQLQITYFEEECQNINTSKYHH